MKSKLLNCVTGMTLFAGVTISIQVAAQNQKGLNKPPHYSVRNLGALGGTSSSANGINNKEWVSGSANITGDTAQHAFFWTEEDGMKDLGTLGGPNSLVNWPVRDDRGLVVGVSETSMADPLGENFCGFGNHLTCLGFLWQEGAMTPLPTLGGNNSYASGINNRGQAVGIAENTTPDPTCLTAPQVLDWKPVIWGPQKGQIRELPLLPGDSTGAAIAINDRGQVAGASGICQSPSLANAVHAVLWDGGSVIDLGSLGGTTHNAATAISSHGHVVGFSNLPGDVNSHAFLWTQDRGMKDLGTLTGDVFSAAFGINNKDQVVGLSCDANGNCRAFLWQNGVLTDLNTLIPPGSPLFLFYAGDINSRGEIVGEAFEQSTGGAPAFVATPCDHDNADEQGCEEGTGSTSNTRQRLNFSLPENVRKLLQRSVLDRDGLGAMQP
jgi:probable HAF family extracellular repeat protein